MRCAIFVCVDGIYICRNDGNPHDRSYLDDVSAPVPAVWDSWYDEKVTYEPDTGVVRYFINNNLKIEYNVGVLPTTADATAQIKVDAWGWNTGHQHFFDDLVVTQESDSATPTPTPVQPTPVGPTPTPTPVGPTPTPMEPTPEPPVSRPKKPVGVQTREISPVGNKMRINLRFRDNTQTADRFEIRGRSQTSTGKWSQWKTIKRLKPKEDATEYLSSLRMQKAVAYQLQIIAINASGKAKSRVITIRIPKDSSESF